MWLWSENNQIMILRYQVISWYCKKFTHACPSPDSVSLMNPGFVWATVARLWIYWKYQLVSCMRRDASLRRGLRVGQKITWKNIMSASFIVFFSADPRFEYIPVHNWGALSADCVSYHVWKNYRFLSFFPYSMVIFEWKARCVFWKLVRFEDLSNADRCYPTLATITYRLPIPRPCILTHTARFNHTICLLLCHRWTVYRIELPWVTIKTSSDDLVSSCHDVIHCFSECI